MAAGVTWRGLAEFTQQLRQMTPEMVAEAGVIALSAGEAAHSEIAAGYSEVSGDLKRGLKLTKSSAGPFGVSVTLRNTSKIAWLYDHGSQARHYVTKSGATHATGTMWGKTAPRHTFVRAVVKHKRYMIEYLKNMVRRHGLTVAGE